MFKKLWQWIERFWQRLFGTARSESPSPEPEVTPLSDAAYERLLSRLLDKVAAGWTQDRVLEEIGDRRDDRFFQSWLHRFGKRLLKSPVPNRELGKRMLQLSEVGCGEIGEIAGQYGRQLLEREFPPLFEAEYEPLFAQLLQKTTQGTSAVSAFLSDLSPRVSIEQWTNWLRGYGERLLVEPEPDQTMGKALLRLSDVLQPVTPQQPTRAEDEAMQAFSQVAGEIGREIRSREIVWEVWEYAGNDRA
ncbi:MAG: hypothetical protein J7641_07115 [Cyanobacteria bacterium SID2]|nr:hypothetical protein [Cyanobacteria bacterium SID2]MBP0005564.1 hypothetical protein [Cyanobacteria bacterium SBC]